MVGKKGENNKRQNIIRGVTFNSRRVNKLKENYYSRCRAVEEGGLVRKGGLGKTQQADGRVSQKETVSQ